MTVSSLCTAVGYNALGGTGVKRGANNTAVGAGAGSLLTDGDNNTCIGNDAGNTLTDGAQNVCVGSNVDVVGASTGGNVVIGYNVTGVAANTATFGIGANTASLGLDGSDTSWAAASSDERLKENIETSKIGLNFINDLRPVNYNWKKAKDVPTNMPQYKEGSEEPVLGFEYGVSQHGFIAQECKAVQDKYADDLADGFGLWIERENGTQTVADGNLVPVLVKALQELSAKVEELETKLNNKEK